MTRSRWRIASCGAVSRARRRARGPNVSGRRRSTFPAAQRSTRLSARSRFPGPVGEPPQTIVAPFARASATWATTISSCRWFAIGATSEISPGPTRSFVHAPRRRSTSAYGDAISTYATSTAPHACPALLSAQCVIPAAVRPRSQSASTMAGFLPAHLDVSRGNPRSAHWIAPCVGRGRAGEDAGVDPGADQGGADVAPPLHDLNEPLGELRREPLHEPRARSRRVLRRLQDDAVAGEERGEGGGERSTGEREVPRRDDPDDTAGNHVYARALLREEERVQTNAPAERMLDDAGPSADGIERGESLEKEPFDRDLPHLETRELDHLGPTREHLFRRALQRRDALGERAEAPVLLGHAGVRVTAFADLLDGRDANRLERPFAVVRGDGDDLGWLPGGFSLQVHQLAVSVRVGVAQSAGNMPCTRDGCQKMR